MKDEKYSLLRRELFATLANQKSHDPKLQQENAIRILEIGVGVGKLITALVLCTVCLSVAIGQVRVRNNN